MTPVADDTLKLALPKGRMEAGVNQLLADAGVKIRATSRGYRPDISLPNTDTKILKPQNIIEMLHNGSRDLGFAGGDWVEELDIPALSLEEFDAGVASASRSIVQLLNTELDPVRIVAAAPEKLLVDRTLPQRGPGQPPLVIASEFQRLTTRWIERCGLNAVFVRSFGATEVFPPEDADCIVDVAATGATLAANSLAIVGEVMRSSTRLYASPAALRHPGKRAQIDALVLILTSVLNARKRVMLEVNVTAERLEAVVKVLPCMREPTIASLHGAGGYAVKAAVPRDQLPALIPRIKATGGTDIVVSALAQIVP